MSSELHVFVMNGCGWCKKLLQEVPLDVLGKSLGVERVIKHTLPTQSPMYSRQGVPEMVLVQNQQIKGRTIGYIPGGVVEIVKKIRM
jgi:thioredoxin-related protein